MQVGSKRKAMRSDPRLKETDMPLEKEWRTYFAPKKTLATLGLEKGMSVADLGCGYGTFAIAAAEIVGKSGEVYAIDIDPAMLRAVSERASKKHLGNVTPILADISTRKKWREPLVDFVLLANVIHGTKRKVSLLKEAAGMLRPNGIIAILNWNVEETPRGPPMRMRPTKNETVELLNEAGYDNPTVVDVPPYHYAVVARSSAE
ncbi:MAG: class I SAM-dependent methyltransferase [Nitrososphaerales archaeon]